MTTNFTIIHRNHGHWDICSSIGRVFRFRGTPGKFLVMDERARPYPVTEFKTITACMSFITDILMFEEITTDHESPGNNKPL